MSELPIDLNSVKIIAPPMHYYEPLGGSRIFIVAEWKTPHDQRPYKFGFYTTTGTSTRGTAHLAGTWAPTYGIEKDGSIAKIMGDKHKTKGSTKYGRSGGMLARVSDILSKIIPPEEVNSIIKKQKSKPLLSQEGQIAVINARFRREGVKKEWADGDIKNKVYDIDSKIGSMRFDIKRKTIKTLPPGTSREGIAAIVDAKLKRDPRYKKLLADRNKLVNDLYDNQEYVDMLNTMDPYGRGSLNEGRIKLSEAALRRLIRKLVLR